MTEDSKKQVPRVIDRFSVMSDRLWYGLIDCFVEPRKILYIRAGEALMLRYPLLDDTSPQRPIFVLAVKSGAGLAAPPAVNRHPILALTHF
jgi:hypothetical protein